MSLIKKIVEIVERTDNADARKNIVKLVRDIKLYKEKVKKFIEANFVDFLPIAINNEGLIHEGNDLAGELKTLKENLRNETKNIYQANDEMSRQIEDLEEASLKLKLSRKLMKIDKLLNMIRQLNEAEKYKEINVALNTIQLLLNDPEDRIIRRLELYQNVKLRLSIERRTLLDNLTTRFKRLVLTEEKSFQKTRSVTVQITKNVQQLVDCVNSITESGYDFTSLTDFLFKNVFEPIICRAVFLNVSENESGFSMNISYSTEPITKELRPNYGVVFVNIRHVLSFLQNMNIQLVDEEYLLARIFQNRRKDLLDLIFDGCLIHSIPETFEEKSKCPMGEDIATLSKVFEELNFFPSLIENEKQLTLEDYSQKVDDLFYQQFTKAIQASATELLKKDLHDMILITEDTTISTNTPLTFPRSMVSKSTLELIRLLEKIINQAKTCTSNKDKQNNHLRSIKAVLENYTFTVQLQHSKFMSQIPQQSALFYNNCMFLSNWVVTNRDTEHCEMDQVVDDLEKQGLEVLGCQIEKQKIQLIQILNEFDPTQSLNAVQPEHFKPIRQCLRQLDLLKNVWQTILPSLLYSKTIADLLNVISLDMVKKIASMEDISSSLSGSLVELIKTVDEKGQSLFEADTSALVVVPTWQKMIHLQFILDASLVEITESWKAGQLSKSFQAEEVKRLIRALFQNTDRRANALSSIV